jgi:hypothetical protein
MRLALCVAIKNRSCVIVDQEDSLSYLHHVQEKLTDCPSHKIKPILTKDDKLALLLMPKMIRSFVSLKKPEDDWVLVVVDYKSTDIDMKSMLEYEVGDKMSWHLETVEDYPHFDRGGGLAKAFEIAETKYKAEAVFFCDADLQFTSRDVFDRAIESVSKGHFYYPIFYSFALANHSKGFWRDTSFGNFACRTVEYKKTEGWYHNVSWGWEDRALADSIPEFLKDREEVPGFFHQWHPLKWDFRVKEYPIKDYIFKQAAVKYLNDTTTTN